MTSVPFSLVVSSVCDFKKSYVVSGASAGTSSVLHSLNNLGAAAKILSVIGFSNLASSIIFETIFFTPIMVLALQHEN